MDKNKYKNKFHEQLIGQYIHSCDVFIWKLGSCEWEWEEINRIFIILHNNSKKHCFTSFEAEKWKKTHNIYDKYFI